LAQWEGLLEGSGDSYWWSDLFFFFFVLFLFLFFRFFFSAKIFTSAKIFKLPTETDPKPKGKAKEKGVSFLLFFSLFLKTFLPDTDFFVLLHFEKQKETEKERAKAEFETSARILDDLYGSSSRGISGSSSSSSSNPNRGLKRAELKGQEGWYLSPRDFQMF